jgi:peptidoglycan/LPS O-acetylase OafA/YrhL
VQLLRFFAGILVVLAHAESRLARSFPEVDEFLESSTGNIIPHWGDLSHVGVHIFFLISGFIMFYSAHGLFSLPGASKSFFLKRVIRIIPIYWILTTLAVFILAYAPQLFTYRESLDWQWIIASYLFIPWTSVDLVKEPVMGLGWTLNFEMYFYFIFSIALFLRQRAAIVFVSIIFLASVFIANNLEWTNPFYQQITNPILLEFLLGIFVAKYYLLKKPAHETISRFLWPLAFLFFIMILIFLRPEGHLQKFVVWGPVSAILLFTGLYAIPEFVLNRIQILVELGNASYSIYLLQIFTLPAMALILKISENYVHMGFWQMLIICTVITLIAGYVFYRVVEKPVTQKLRRYMDNRVAPI